ncbi:MAG: hypothetical protein COT43_04605 [Candidatus Marinimicrobia bacterium CG08_land_8_20_14_0_20_45_22]|nr:MAG: hypothetical protein COT43_04605 [Candidatus Marinimicrobia bacterium CG08_land_8_20_14_0_20_45_22]
MIRLNLATSPGYQNSEIFLQMPDVEKSPTQEKPVVSATEIQPSVNTGEDVFAKAEKNLDLIEQAEKGEFVPKHTSVPPKKKSEIVSVKTHRVRRVVFRYLGYLILIGIIGAGFWGYRSGFYKQVDFSRIASFFIEKFSRAKKTELADKTQNVAESILTVLPFTQPSDKDEIAPEYIKMIIAGKNRLDFTRRVLENLPQNSILQYLYTKDNSVTFIMNIRTQQECDVLKSALEGTSQFVSTEVFRIEPDLSVGTHPVRLTAIVKFQEDTARSGKCYRFIDDIKTSQVIFVAGKRSMISLSPLKIFSAPSPDVRMAQINGGGTYATIATFFDELQKVYVNCGIEDISIHQSASDSLQNNPLNMIVDVQIFPPRAL